VLEKFFLHRHVQIGAGTHSATYWTVTFPEAKDSRNSKLVMHFLIGAGDQDSSA